MDIKETLDNPFVFVLLLAIVIFGIGQAGQYVGKRFGAPGVQKYFGGQPA